MKHQIFKFPYLIFISVMLFIQLLFAISVIIKSFQISGKKKNSISHIVQSTASIKNYIDCKHPVALYSNFENQALAFRIETVIQYSLSPCFVNIVGNKPININKGYTLIHKSHPEYKTIQSYKAILNKNQDQYSLVYSK